MDKVADIDESGFDWESGEQKERPEAKIIVTLGPPGCGKTTQLAASAQKARLRYQDARALIIGSLTNAAAKEIASRDTGVHPAQVGTLHALCYRQLNHPELTEKHLADWNKTHAPKYRQTISDKRYDRTPENAQPEESYNGNPGDALMQRLDLYRHGMHEFYTYKKEIQQFAEKWQEWKEENMLVDFTDLIERGLQWEFDDAAPFGAKLGIFDECQDFSKLEWALVHKWSKAMQFVLVAGDDDQCLYAWRGADPNSLIDMDPAPIEVRVLPQSYRLPHKIHTYCEDWIHRLSHRMDKPYAPRDAEGLVKYTNGGIHQITPILHECERAYRDKKTLMILTACGYQIDRIILKLRAHGIPFSNTWRIANGRWNPLAKRGRGQISAMDRVKAYTAAQDVFTWTPTQLKFWTHLIEAKSGLLVRGAKQKIKDMPNHGAPMSYSDLLPFFTKGVLSEAINGEIPYLFNHMSGNTLKGLKYVRECLNAEEIYKDKRNEQPPLITVGTIHSVKGGEADRVIICPDLSPAAWDEWDIEGPGRDGILRQFYVGMSRAKEELILATPESRRAIVL